MLQQALVKHFPTKTTFSTSLNQKTTPYPSQNTFPSSLQQQTLRNTSSTSLQQLPLDNPHPNKSTLSSSLQEQDMVNPYPTKNTFPSSLDLINPYPTKPTFSTSFHQQALLNLSSLQHQALTNPDSPYSEQNKLDFIPQDSTSFGNLSHLSCTRLKRKVPMNLRRDLKQN